MRIPEQEVWFSFARSGGPGGQNVNKVSSKVILHWAIKDSRALSEFQKNILLRSPNILSLLDSDGILTLVCQESRSQAMNRKIALEKIEDLIRIALIPKKPRKKTKLSRNQKEKRIQSKKSRSSRLQARRIGLEE